MASSMMGLVIDITFFYTKKKGHTQIEALKNMYIDMMHVGTVCIYTYCIRFTCMIDCIRLYIGMCMFIYVYLNQRVVSVACFPNSTIHVKHLHYFHLSLSYLSLICVCGLVCYEFAIISGANSSLFIGKTQVRSEGFFLK